MPKGQRIDLPDTLERSPKHAQDIYRETLRSAHETYNGDEARAHRVAYAAVKHEYKKSGDRWVPRTLEDKTRDELYEDAKDLEIAGRSKMNKDELLSAVRDARDDR